jgi:hypothetical protein
MGILSIKKPDYHGWHARKKARRMDGLFSLPVLLTESQK